MHGRWAKPPGGNARATVGGELSHLLGDRGSLQNSADQQNPRLLPRLLQNLDEVAVEAVTMTELGATIGGGRDKLQRAKRRRR